jgi:hypothetical protein
MRRLLPVPSHLLLAILAAGGAVLAAAGQPARARHNVIVFVADGLRHDSVNAVDTPALWSVRQTGVHFADSYSVFPTFTTANASAIATGHGLGDTGDFSNTIWTGYPTFDTGAFGLSPGTPVPFIENDRVIADLDAHFAGNYLGHETLLSTARAAGYQTAAVGKVGPVAIQDAAAIAPVDNAFPLLPPGIVIDDATGSGAAPAVPIPIMLKLRQTGLAPESPTRTNGYGATSQYNNGYAGDVGRAGTLAANVVQQQWFADVTTQVILPEFTAARGTPFALVFWSRDPDGTQHNEGDSLGSLSPGINGDASRLAIRNADRNLRQILDWLDAHPDVKAATDLFVTSDHGFATISRRELDRTGKPAKTEASRHDYVGPSGKVDTLKGTLPNGFLAIDLAASLQTSLYDPDQHADGSRLYRKLSLNPIAATWEHPEFGDGLIGNVMKPDGSDATVIVAANGGSDLLYVPSRRRDVVERVVNLLLSYDYVGGVFVDDEFGRMPGTLPLSAINLVGDSRVPRPAIVVAFKVFRLNPEDPLTAVQVSDTSLQTGQGMHGGFGRDSTFNNMAAIGPDFKEGFVDNAPVGNADIAPTLARILGLRWPASGQVPGRVIFEALIGSPARPAMPMQYQRSSVADGRQTILLYRKIGGVRYLHTACFVTPATADRDACR